MATYRFECSGKNIPKSGHGEDAFFFSPNLIVVCDGVGSWSQMGIDAGKYAGMLRDNMAAVYEQNRYHYIKNPK